MVAAAAAATTQTQKPRWGELEDDGEDLDFLLPPKHVIGPDENGVKKVIEYKFTDGGHKVKTTRNIRIRKLAQTRLNKHVLERRSWPKFGDAVNEDVGSRLTMISIEEIVIQNPRVPGTNQEDTKATEDTISQNKASGVIMLCRTCGKRGDHWTARCPYRDPTQPTDTFTDKSLHTETGVAAPGGCATKNSYVPPGMRAGATERPIVVGGGGDMRRRNEENSLRVTNLSEDTREQDLHDLFRPFGQVSRVYVALDQKTGDSRGFGFVNFVNREDAERAINKINGYGYGYDNLILKVEWAAPRAT